MPFRTIQRLAAILVLALLGACSSEAPEKLVPAPLGERSALERLAEAYTAVSDEKLTVSPMALAGDERHRFVTEVFARAGYDYAATLKQVAGAELDRANQLQMDLIDLLLLPHRNQKMVQMAPADIYPPQELMDIATIERKLNAF